MHTMDAYDFLQVPTGKKGVGCNKENKGLLFLKLSDGHTGVYYYSSNCTVYGMYSFIIFKS